MTTPASTVSDLLDALCRNLHRDFFNGPNELSAHQETVNAKHIKRCKSLAFEVLLKKSRSKAHITDDPPDLSKELRYRQFEWNLELGLRRSMRFGSYGFTQVDGGKSGQHQNGLLEKSIVFLETEIGGDGESSVLDVLVHLIDFGQGRQNQEVGDVCFSKRLLFFAQIEL